MVPGMTVFGVRSLPQVVALLTGADEIPEAPPVPPLSGQPLLTWRGEERLGEVDLADVRGMADPRFALEVAAAGGHHLLLSGPKGAGKTTLAERLPGLLPDLDAGGVAGADRDPLAGRHLAAGCADDRAATVQRAAPLGDAGQPARRRQRAGAPRRGEQGPPRGAVPRRVPAVRRRHHRRAAPAAGERRGHDRAGRGGGDVPGPVDGGAGLQPVPLRRLPPAQPRPRAAPARSSSAAPTAAGSPARSPTGSTSPATSSRCAEHEFDDRLARPESTADVRGAGAASRAAGRPRATSAPTGGSTATCPARRCASAGR